MKCTLVLTGSGEFLGQVPTVFDRFPHCTQFECTHLYEPDDSYKMLSFSPSNTWLKVRRINWYEHGVLAISRLLLNESLLSVLILNLDILSLRTDRGNAMEYGLPKQVTIYVCSFPHGLQ